MCCAESHRHRLCREDENRKYGAVEWNWKRIVFVLYVCIQRTPLHAYCLLAVQAFHFQCRIQKPCDQHGFVDECVIANIRELVRTPKCVVCVQTQCKLELISAEFCTSMRAVGEYSIGRTWKCVRWCMLLELKYGAVRLSEHRVTASVCSETNTFDRVHKQRNAHRILHWVRQRFVHWNVCIVIRRIFDMRFLK